MKTNTIVTGMAAIAAAASINVGAQTATAGADYNRVARANAQESARTEKLDRPVRTDPIGNSIIGGGATGMVRGAAAGVVTAARGAAVGTAAQSAKDAAKNVQQPDTTKKK